MANYQVRDAYGSVITIQSSTFGGVERQIVGASIMGGITTTPSGNQSVSGTVGASIIGAVPITGISSVMTYATRNDTLASTLGADGTIGPLSRDSAGRLVIKPFTADDSATFQVNTSVVSTSVTLLRAAATGLRQYVTDFLIANTGSVNTLVQFKDGSTSIIGQTIAPATGGSNAAGLTIPLKTAPSQDLTFQAGAFTSVLYVTVKGYQAP